MNILKRHKTFEGETIFCEHESSSTKTKMKFSAFLPKDIEQIDSAIIWLSGLTCNEENFITKAGAQKYLAGTNTMIICPDTSPRGLDLKGEDESYDFGTGAGFYVNATKAPYDTNYNMYDYITKDLVKLLKEEFNVTNLSISGHSMGGHGALVIALRTDIFKSVSAFSPILNPTNVAWGQKALAGYLGDNKEDWSQYDTTELYLSKQENNKEHPNPFNTKVLIEQGLDDEFLKEQLGLDRFEEITKENKHIQINKRAGYDHSYYFISSFIGDHVGFHLENLNN